MTYARPPRSTSTGSPPCVAARRWSTSASGRVRRGHVPGAVLIPMGQLAGRVDELDRAARSTSSAPRATAERDDRLPHAAGFDAASVAGGTRAWARSGRRTSGDAGSVMTPTSTIVPIETPTLGDRSYLVHDGEVAFVVDPQRDIDRVLELLEEHGVRLTHVFETHIHNDYVTGGLALAQRTGAAYLVNADDEVSFERTPVRDGEVVEVGGRMRVTALATPGHTFTHLSYALTDATSGRARSACSPAGRCCSAPPAAPTCSAREHTDDLVRHQHASAHRLADVLPDDGRGVPDPRLRLVLLRHPVRGDVVDHRPGEAGQPRPDPGRGDLRRRAARRSGRLAGLLRPHGPGQRRRARPRPTCPRPRRPTPPSCAAASRPASGSSTCATGPPSPPATCPARSTSASTAASRPTWAG